MDKLKLTFKDNQWTDQHGRRVVNPEVISWSGFSTISYMTYQWPGTYEDSHLYGTVGGYIRLIPPVASEPQAVKPKIICYCGSLRVALDAFKRAEYESVISGDIALLPCCMFVDIQREYGAESDYKVKADWLHKRKIDICDEVFVLNVGGYIGESTRAEINYAIEIGKPVKYLEA